MGCEHPIRQWRLETVALHGDPGLAPPTGAEAQPIFQTAAFEFPNAEEAADRFALKASGPIYSRLGNPTVEAFETRMAALEGGVGALATASGQAATFLVAAALCQHGGSIVASRSLYGGIYSLLKHRLGALGIRSTFVPVDDLAAWEAAVGPDTACLYVEMVGNPLLDTPDLWALADLAHQRGVPLVVDSTLATPALCKPIRYGADLVVHSATKYVGGHGTAIGGVVVDGGSFDWSRIRWLTEPDEAYHGLVFLEQFGPQAFLAYLRAHWLRDVGPCMAPLTAWLLLQGLETLPLRMERHNANAAAVADWLAQQRAVDYVLYPARPDHPTHRNAMRFLSGGGGMVGVVLRGGLEAARRVAESLRIFTHAANMGDCKSLVVHPASTTHAPVEPALRAEMGIADGFLRLSVGLEHEDDLISDLECALEAVASGVLAA